MSNYKNANCETYMKIFLDELEKPVNSIHGIAKAIETGLISLNVDNSAETEQIIKMITHIRQLIQDGRTYLNILDEG